MKILAIVATFFIVVGLTAQSNTTQLTDGKSSNNTQSFAYQLTTKCTTSGGIYNGDNVLVRTLWAQKGESAGRHTYTWDGLDDSGNPMTKAKYTWKVLSNNAKYIWEGVIGNTSDSMSGPTKHKGFMPVTTICFAGSNAYYSNGYQEAITMTYKFDTLHIGQRTEIIPTMNGLAPVNIRNCTDGNYVYWAAFDAYASTRSFIYATKVSDDSQVKFANGYLTPVVHGSQNGALKYSAINYENNSLGNITDISVQKQGNFLFVARPNRIMVMNKINGVLIDSVLVDVGYLRVDATDNYLWVSHSNLTTERYAINKDGSLTSNRITITNTQPVVAMDVNLSNTLLAICEGGTKQIINFYNPVTGAFIKTFGQTRGYLTNANVSNNKFYWNDARGTYPTFVAFSPNGSFWVGDWGNGRVQHYDANFRYISQIAWIPVFYNCGVDHTNLSRVFADMKEYKVDWVKPLDNGKNGSWTLVRNWGGDLQSNQYDKYLGLLTPMTFPNGHTFCFLPTSLNGPKYQLVELRSDGTKNYTSVFVNSNTYLDKSGDLYSQTRMTPNKPTIWSKYAFVGYDNNVPHWASTAIVIQTSPINITTDEPGYGGYNVSYRPNCITADSVYIAFHGGTGQSPGYHLGGVKNNKWVFQTARATTVDYKGGFPTGERFDIGNGERANGSVAVALGKTIIWGYNGEFWKASETNMFTQTYSNGLVVNQFGVATGWDGHTRATLGIAGDAGNAFSIHVVTVHGNNYLIHNDESIQGGIHVWKITGMNTIHLLSGNFDN